jgi:formimidoylglutamate deiminase
MPIPVMLEAETGWLPDLLYRDGHFESDIAMFAGEDGRIVRFSKAPEDLRKARRLPHMAILPGLVDVHSHSFQRAIRGRTEHRTSVDRDNFWTWREAMYHAATQLTPDDIYDVARMTFLEALTSGITTIGEFHYLHHSPDGTPYSDPNLLAIQNVRAAAEAGLRIALLRTAYVRAGWRKEPNPGQNRFITPRIDDFINHTEALRNTLARYSKPTHAWVGVAPHSVRAVPLDYLRLVTDYAKSQSMPVHMHVSEQPAEIEACLGEYGRRPIELLSSEGMLDSRFTGIHATHVTKQEIADLAAEGAKVCACPTTERNLGDGIGPADQWAAAGVTVCYGSDSNVQVNLLEDARQLEYHLRLQKLERAVLAPDLSSEGLAARLFDNATISGAHSLGAPGGSLKAGSPADFFTVNLNDLSIAGAGSQSLLTNIVFSAERTAIRDVYVNGHAVIQDGRHRLQDEIVERFARVQQRLWGTLR